MASLRVLVFDHEGRPVQFDTWLDDLQLYLLSDSKDSVSMFDLASGAATAPPATADSSTRSQWLTHDAAARLAIRNHLPLAECAHFGQRRTTQALYDAVVARYSSPATAALGRLLLPYLFPELSAFTTVEDLVSHVRASDTRYHVAVPAENHFLSLDPTSLTLDLLDQHLLTTETSAVAVGAARGTPRPPFFEGCSPSPLAPSYPSADAAEVSVPEDVGAASASAKRRRSKGKGGRGGAGGSGGGGGGSGSGGGGSSGGGGGGGTVGRSGGSGGGGGGSGGSGGSGGGGTGSRGTGARRVGSRGGQHQQQQRWSETPSPQQLHEWFLRGASGGSCPYVIHTGDRAGQTCGRLHTQHRCFSRLDDAWHAEFGDDVELPRCAEGECYRCVPPDPGIATTALGASESGTLPGTAPAEALHTFTLDSAASGYFFRDSTTPNPLPTPVPVRLADPSGGPVVAHSSTILPFPAVPSGSLSGLHLPSFSTNLVSITALQDAMVTTTTPGGQRVSICTCTRTGRHQTTFTRRPGSSLYILTTEPCQVAASAQVSASLPPLPPSPALPCLPCVEGRQRAAPHSSSFPSTLAPLQTLHMDVWGPARVSGQSRERYFLLVVDDYTRYTTVFPLRSKGQVVDVLIPWIRTVRLQLRERFGQDLPVLRLHSDRSADKLSPRAIPCVFHGFVPDAPGSQFYHPTSRGVFPSQDITFDESVPFYCLFPYRSAPPPPPPLFLAPGPPPVDPLPPQGPAPLGVSQVDPLPGPAPVQVAINSGAARGAASWGAEPGGAESEGAETGGAEPGGVETGGAKPGGVTSGGGQPGGAEPEGVEPGGAASEGAESGGAEPQGAASSGGSAGASPRLSPHGASGAGGAGAAGAGGPRVVAGAGVTGAARPGGVEGARAGDLTESSTPGAGGAGVGGPGVGGAGGGRAGAVDPERYEPASHPVSPVRTARRVPCSRPPPFPGTHAMTLRPSSVPLRVPLPAPPESSLPKVPDPESDRARAASPTVSRLLAIAVTDPSFESAAASALVAELLEFAAACRLDYASALVAESASASPPSVRGECALCADVLEDRQEELKCLAAAVPRFASMLLAPEGDPDAPDIPTPRYYAEAITGPYSSQWQVAMDAEMASWKSTGTYVDEVPPPGANIVDGMWIFKVKQPPGSPPAFKARYVARGFSQRQGVDYFQTFSPTPKMTTLRVLLHVAAQRDYALHFLDFSIAFLQGSLHEEIWLCRPPCFNESFPAGSQWSLRRAVYGLRQAPREWHDTLRTSLEALGFAPATADPSLFLSTDTSLPPFYVLVYVDDLVFATADTEALTLVKSELQKRHTCTDLGELRNYLDLQITRDRASHSLSAPPSDESIEPSGPYPELVGCLMYLMTCTRPDLAYPLSLLARYVAPGRHRKVHSDAVKRVLRYLCSTSGMGLVLGGQDPVVLTGHADASWVDDSATQRSSQGYTFSLGSGSVSWRSTRSSSVLSSSCEAEIYAGAMAAQELRWLTYLLTDLGEKPRSPPVLYVDNKAMITLCQEPRLEHKMKHIALRYFLARELQQRGQLCLAHVATRANTADVFTKALPPGDHQRFVTVCSPCRHPCLSCLSTAVERQVLPLSLAVPPPLPPHASALQAACRHMHLLLLCRRPCRRTLLLLLLLPWLRGYCNCIYHYCTGPSAPPLGPLATVAATPAATAAPECCATMASLRVLAFDHEGRPVAFDTWHNDLQLYLLSDIKDSVSLLDHVSGVAPAPPTTADSGTRSQWLSRDATARLAIRNHLPVAECTDFGQHRTAQALYDAVLARYSSPTIAALGRLLLPYLFPELSAFANVADLVTHLRTSDARYRATVPAEDHFLSLDPTSLTVDLLEQHLLAAETSAVAVGAARGTPRPPFFEGCSPSPLSPSFASAAAANISVTEDVGAASTSAKRRSSKGKGGRGGGGGSGGGGGGSGSGGGGSGGGGGGSGGGGGGGTGGGSGGSGGGGGGSGGSGRWRRWDWWWSTDCSVDILVDLILLVDGTPVAQTSQLQRSSSLVDSNTTAVPCSSTKPVEQLFYCERSAATSVHPTKSMALPKRGWDQHSITVNTPALTTPGVLSLVTTSSALAGRSCLGIAAAALGASASGTPPGTAPAEALHTFTLDSGASRCFFHDSTTLTPLPAPVPVRLADLSGGTVVAHSSTVLPCPAVPSGSLSGLHLPSFSMNLVSTAALQDAMVTTTTPGGQRVSICTCTRTGRHLATFTRRPGWSLYTLATEPPQVATSAQVSASGQVAASCSCCLLSHQTLLWHHRLDHPSLPRLCGMHSRFLVCGLPRSLPPLPPYLPCIEGRQRAAPHSSSFPQTTAPLQTLHMDVWGPARVSGQGLRLQLRERFGTDLPVQRLHSDIDGEFSSDLLRDFCRGEGILQLFTLPDFPQQNGIAERRIGLFMEVAHTSMIHAAAAHFLWSFAVRYAAHQLNLWPRVSLPETSLTLCWTGKVGDASMFRFYHPTSRRVLPSQDVTFDESVPFYRLFPYRSAPPPPPPLFLAPGPPPVDPLPPQGPAPSGVSQVDPLPGTAPVQVAVGSGAAPAVASGGAVSGGAEPGGAGSEGAGSGGAEPGGGEPEGVEPGGAESEGAESGGAEPWSDASSGVGGAGDTGAGGAAVPAGAGGTGGAAATGPGGARTSGAGAVGTGGVGSAGARDPTEPGGAGAELEALAPEALDLQELELLTLALEVLEALCGRDRTSFPYFSRFLVSRLPPPFPCPPPDQSQPPLQPASPLPAPSPYTEQSGGLTELREPASRPVSPIHTARCAPRSRPPPVPSTHAMALRSSSIPLRVPLPAPPASSLPEVPDPASDRACAANPTASRLLATAVTNPSFEFAAASALVAELLDFAAACRLDYATALVAESVSATPPSVGDLDAPDIPTTRSYAEGITGPYSSQWQVAMDAEMASWKSTGTYVDEVPPSRVNIVDGMWIFRVKRPPGSPPVFKARYVARGFSQRQGVDYFQTFSPASKITTLRVLLHVAAQRDYKLHSLDFSTAFLQGSLNEEIWLRRPPGFTRTFPAGTEWSLRRPVYGLRQAPFEWHDTLRTTLAALGFAPSTADPSLFLRTDTSLPPFYVLVYVDDLIFATADTEALTLVKSELQKRHTCTDLGEVRSYLGLQITQDRARRTITLTQSHMVHQVLQRFGFLFSSPQPTPLSTSHSLSAPPSDESVEPIGPYPELVGCLITSGMGLVLRGRGALVRTGHADASWVDDSATQRSSQGYTISLGSGSVSWRSTRSSSVLSSSCEAEIYAGAMAAQKLRWLTYLLTDLGEQPRSPPVLYVDNKAMIALCKEHRLEHRIKHIALRYFPARELQQRGQLRLAYVATRANTADVFTKALPPCDHQRFSTVLGLYGLFSEDIKLSHNNFSGSLQPFSKLPTYITTLDLRFNKFTGSIPRCLTRPQLNYLDLQANALTGEGKQPLTFLNLACIALSGPPTPLFSPSCSVLFLPSHSSQSCTPCCNTSLLDLTPRSSLLYPYPIPPVCLLLPPIPHPLRPHPRLLPGQAGPHHPQPCLQRPLRFSCSASLQALYLSSNRLSGPIPGRIRSFKIRMRLRLDNNALTGPIPAGVSKMKMLQRLGLSYNKLSEKIPAVWPARLWQVKLAGNRLSGVVPAALSKLNRGSFKPGNPNLCGKPLLRACA
ncbi:unnamed protein product [Closterium sp. NIES-54]